MKMPTYSTWISILILQHIDEIPDDLKPLYKTVWEISQRTLIDMAADRGAFIDQSQSFNVFFAEPNYGKLTSMHFYGWKKVIQCLGMLVAWNRLKVASVSFQIFYKFALTGLEIKKIVWLQFATSYKNLVAFLKIVIAKFI